jgi:Zn-finger nucleic acid-binding protein
MTDRQGVEIDYCPKCRGVWLDRGELEKIIERSAEAQPAPPPDYPPRQNYNPQQDYHKNQPYGPHGYRKKKSFLDDIFDF